MAVLLGMTAGAAYGQKRYVADEVVAVVGNSMVLLSELEEASRLMELQRREQGYTGERDVRSEALEFLMTQRFLSNQAVIDSVELGETNLNAQVDKQMDRIITERGSLQEVEKFYNKPIFKVRSDIYDRIRERELANRMEGEVKAKATITPAEVEKFYRRLPKDSIPVIPEQYVYAQIAKYPPATDDAKLKVRERLLALRERIIKGENFSALARLYSVDGSAMRGGELEPMPKEGFVAPFANALEGLKPGQISNVVETEYGYHLIQMLDHQGDIYHVKHILMRPQFGVEDQTKASRQLDSLARLIRLDSLSFTDAVARFSDDLDSRMNEGVVVNKMIAENYNMPRLASVRFLKEELPVDDYAVLSRMKPGEVSDPFRATDYKGNEMYKIIKLMEIIPSHRATFRDDYIKLEDMALEDKKEKMFRQWLNEKVSAMYVKVEEPYREYDFENKVWLK